MKYKYTDRNTVKGIPEMEKPNAGYNYFGNPDQYEKDVKAYNTYIASLTEYPLQGEKPEWWPEELEKNIHFKVTCEAGCEDICSAIAQENDFSCLVAIPLSEPKQEQKFDLEKWNKPESNFLIQLKKLVTQTYGNKELFYKFIAYFNNSGECGGDKFNDDIEDFISQNPNQEKQEESEDDIWEDVYIMFQSWANSADTFGEHIEDLKNRFTITRKNNSQ